MIITLGAKNWTWDSQQGLRLYKASIEALAPILNVPDRRGRYASLQHFLECIQASRGSDVRPRAYSRPLCVGHFGDPLLSCHVTIADNTDRRPPNTVTPSIQGYITALNGTWFDAWVQRQLDVDVQFDYHCVSQGIDLLLVR